MKYIPRFNDFFIPEGHLRQHRYNAKTRSGDELIIMEREMPVAKSMLQEDRDT